MKKVIWLALISLILCGCSGIHFNYTGPIPGTPEYSAAKLRLNSIDSSISYIDETGEIIPEEEYTYLDMSWEYAGLSSVHSDGVRLYRAKSNRKNRVIAIDSEDNITLEISKLLKERLLDMGYDVMMLRESENTRLDSIARTLIANNKADCHITLHVCPDDTNDYNVPYSKIPSIDYVLDNKDLTIEHVIDDLKIR